MKVITLIGLMMVMGVTAYLFRPQQQVVFYQTEATTTVAEVEAELLRETA